MTIRYDPYSDEAMRDPYAVYRRLRDEAPVYYNEDYDCWFLSRFEDIWSALHDVAAFTVRAGQTPIQLLSRERPEGDYAAVAGLDPPAHTRTRAKIGGYFKPGAVSKLEPWTRELVRGLIDQAYERGELDVLRDFGLRTSVRIASRIAGFPLEDADELAALVMAFFEREPGSRGITERGAQAIVKMQAYLLDFVAQRRKLKAQPADLTAILLEEEFEGRRLSDEEITQHLNLVLVGGTETLPKVVASGVYRLWQHPDQRAQLARDPELVPTAFQEMLRYDMPTQMLGRVMRRDKEIHGQKLSTGQAVLFLWPSGNRDEREFPDADAFDIHRDAPRILSFGHGTHTCLGAHVARMEGKVLIQELLRRIPEYEVIEDRTKLMPSEFLRGYESLPIRFDVR